MRQPLYIILQFFHIITFFFFYIQKFVFLAKILVYMFLHFEGFLCAYAYALVNSCF